MGVERKVSPMLELLEDVAQYSYNEILETLSWYNNEGRIEYDHWDMGSSSEWQVTFKRKGNRFCGSPLHKCLFSRMRFTIPFKFLKLEF